MASSGFVITLTKLFGAYFFADRVGRGLNAQLTQTLDHVGYFVHATFGDLNERDTVLRVPVGLLEAPDRTTEVLADR